MHCTFTLNKTVVPVFLGNREGKKRLGTGRKPNCDFPFRVLSVNPVVFGHVFKTRRMTKQHN